MRIEMFRWVHVLLPHPKKALSAYTTLLAPHANENDFLEAHYIEASKVMRKCSQGTHVEPAKQKNMSPATHANQSGIIINWFDGALNKLFHPTNIFETPVFL